MAKKKPLSITHPALAKEWHPTKNGDLTPDDVTFGSHKKIHWQCQKFDDHIYESKTSHRTGQNTGCSFCSGRIPCYETSIAFHYPELLKRWDYDENNGKTFTRYKIEYPLVPELVSTGTGWNVAWKCPVADDHRYYSSPPSMIRAFKTESKHLGCVICEGRIIVKSNSIRTLKPHLADEWNKDLNHNLTPDNCGIGSRKLIWFNCPKDTDHVYPAWIFNRTGKGDGCSICVNKRVIWKNCIATTHPNSLNEWDFQKNKVITTNNCGYEQQVDPYNVHSNSGIIVNWICSNCKHEWPTKIKRIKNETGCPVCAGHIANDKTSLAAHFPEIAEEFDEELNKDLFIKLYKGSVIIKASVHTLRAQASQIVHWRCKINNNHTWPETPSNRTGENKSGCPHCRIRNMSEQKLRIKFELITIFQKIDPKGYSILGKKKVFAMDVFIEELNLILEFDGSYWHKGKEKRDKEKSKEIINEGFDLIRIREKPLKKITTNDVIVPFSFKNPKPVVDKVLVKISELYKNDKTLKNKINKYLKNDSPQNTNDCNDFIISLKKNRVLS